VAEPLDEFESAFAQAASERAAEQATATQTPAPEPQANAEGSPAPSAPATPEASSAPAQQEPEPVSVEELKRQLDQAVHRERSSASRVSAFQKEANRLAALVKELQEANAAKAAAPAAAPAPAPDDVLTAAPDLEQAVGRRIESALAAANKAVAEANARAEAALQAAEQARASVDPIVAQQQESARSETWRGLDERFKGYDWRSDLKTREFDEWLSDAPDAVKLMFEKGQTVKEGAAVLSLFYGATGKKPAAQPAANEVRANPNQERLRQAAGVSSRGSSAKPVAGLSDDDFEGNFAAAAKALKQA
jgi:hypothetical protein